MTFYNQHSTALVGSGSENNQGGYKIQRSLRFRSSASAYLNRTPASAGNRKTWTWSGWVKRSELVSGNLSGAFFSWKTGAAFGYIAFYQDGFRIYDSNAGYLYQTTAKYRDVSSWYHIVVRVDTTEATASNRVRLYINEVEVTSFTTETNPAQNADTNCNTTILHTIGLEQNDSKYFDGYLTEVNFIDGQALDPSYFGETDAITGVWKPKAYGGTYGTNGFYLNFSDNTSTTTLGYDQSSNSNNWTTNNISLTAGSTYDSMTDVPTLTSASAANYATLNPLDKNGITLDQANLLAQSPGATWKSTRSTIGMSSGKWYCEFEGAGGNTPFDCQVGVGRSDLRIASYAEWTTANPSVIYSAGDGSKWLNGTNSSYGSSYTIGDIIGVAFDADARTVTFYKNNVSQGQISTGWSAGTFSFEISLYGRGGGTTSAWFNAGQRPFAYTPPTGYKALNTYNLPDSTIEDGSDYFNTVLYSGANPNAAQSITGVGFQPDFLWIKSRVTGYGHALQDVLRGATGRLQSDTTGTESVSSTYVSSFDSDGFSLGVDYGQNAPNEPYVAWNWKANGSGVSNTDGSITSTVSANTTSGFSIVTATTNSSGIIPSAGHGLGVVPAMIIMKARTGTDAWYVYHKNSTANATQGTLNLNTTSAVNTTNGTSGGVDKWTVSSTTFGAGNAAWFYQANTSHVFYCFAPIEGFSAFGSYTGNGSTDGPFVYTGFRPRYIMLKRSSTASVTYGWQIYDTARSPYNTALLPGLWADTSAAEAANTYGIDLLSNGFKLISSGVNQNANGDTYIYMAFAENPFKNSLAR